MGCDAEIVASALRGDDDAFKIIVFRYQGMVYATALGILSDFDDARDACQETFLRAYLSIGQLRDAKHLGGWLRAISMNVCRKMYASKAMATTDFPLEAIPDQSQRPDREMERENRRALVRAAMSQLSEKSREALSLHYMSGLSAVEIAQVVGATPAAMRQRLRRARMELKQEVISMVRETIRNEQLSDDFSEELNHVLESAKKAFVRADYKAAIPALERASDIAPEDTFVTMLLADAYSRNRTLEELKQDSSPRDRAEKVILSLLQREPDNLAAKIKLAELQASHRPYRELVAEHEENLRLARDTALEPWALLRMARVHAPRGRYEEARPYYEELVEREQGLGGIAYIELALCSAVTKDYETGVDCLRKAVAFLNDPATDNLGELSRKVFGERYVAFWDRGVDERLYKLFQAQVYLAGFLTALGQVDAAETELAQAAEHVASAHLAGAKDELRRMTVAEAESRFPGLKTLPSFQKIA